MTTRLNGYADMDFVQLASGVGSTGRVTLIPDFGFSGRKTEFTGIELRQLAAVVGQMRSASSRPSFDCGRARTTVEKAVCADSKLAAMDRALSWLWGRVAQTAEQNAEQKKWLQSRSNCPPPGPNWSESGFSIRSFISPADPQGCIGLAYAERIQQLASQSSAVAVSSGTYTTDRPLELPRGKNSRVSEKFFMARGFREDEISIKDLGSGAGKITGHGVWANGHLCSFDTSEEETKRIGSRLQIFEDSARPSDEYSISFAITPDVVIKVGGSSQFQCGARGSWSDVYFRQPADMISRVESVKSLQQ
jgi:hypothetical protein